MEFTSSEVVDQLLKNYPLEASGKLHQLRQLIRDTAMENGILKLVETTKWGEPSYVTKTGSTIRMDWKAKTPDKCYLYFICSTELVNTFRFVFGDELTFEGDRAIVLELGEPIPADALKRCIGMALTYHKIKHLPMLGQ